MPVCVCVSVCVHAACMSPLWVPPVAGKEAFHCTVFSSFEVGTMGNCFI